MPTLHSMTGFARTSGEQGRLAWVWEVRSVNGRGLDLRVRVPSGLTHLEAKARDAFQGAFTRGNMQITLSLSHAAGEAAYEIDEVWLQKLIEVSNGGVSGMSDPAHLPHLMQVDGVVRPLNVASALTDDVSEKILNDLNELISKLKTARSEEGRAMQAVIEGLVDQVDVLSTKAAKCAAALPQAIFKNLDAKFAQLLGEKLDADRLTQEAAVLAVKADVREELDRLSAHVVSARALIAQGSPIGRKLDFLSQEFNREINTLCSKSSDSDLTKIGLDLKAVNEQFREQAANVE